MDSLVFVDVEVNPQKDTVTDYGAVKADAAGFVTARLHAKSAREFYQFVSGAAFIGGHNILAHDWAYIAGGMPNRDSVALIDTLTLSPLLFPHKPYHALLKDDKLLTDEVNNPLNDAIKAMTLFYAEVNAFQALSVALKTIFYRLLHREAAFTGFFSYLQFQSGGDAQALIQQTFAGMICENAPLSEFIRQQPVALAYALALIATNHRYSITPPWVHRNYPAIDNIIRSIRNTPCAARCAYCRRIFDVNRRLTEIFGYDAFRTYDGEPLQEEAAKAAVNNASLLAIFPTGGGKSVTFQLPALMAGETARGLTVVISPLQSLMKDQVDNLAAIGIVDAVTVNGLLSPIERAEALQRVESGLASLLYISPESLRSRTIERVLLTRHVVRFVIDEAHCFSAWGQDFRVDYLYIGDFIRAFIKAKGNRIDMPISCFTATAKQKVISDIKDYFKQKLDVTLDIYATHATRTNLRYEVLYKENDQEKYSALRNLIAARNCPTIVYVSRTKKTHELAQKLTEDGFSAQPFNGRMDRRVKIAHQEAFINGTLQIIVATSAFGMGVDKKDVRLVVHYDISDSLENYVQEAGRAGRDPALQAECYVLFNDNDLDKHFILLNQTKLSISEIQQVWNAIKHLTRKRPTVYCSALEIARQAGWDDTVADIETRVTTAVSALENAGYIRRGKNAPRIFATSILVKSMAEASERINRSHRFDPPQKQDALRIMQRLISSRSHAKALHEEGESRVDYLADLLGIPKAAVIDCINRMREEHLLADTRDMSAYLRRSDNQNKSLAVVNKFLQLEAYMLSQISDDGDALNVKEINDRAEKAQIKDTTVKAIKTLLYYWTIKGYIRKTLNASDKYVDIIPEMPVAEMKRKFERRRDMAQFIVKHLYEQMHEQTAEPPQPEKEDVLVLFSVQGLKDAYGDEISLFKQAGEAGVADVEDALLYLNKTDALSLEGGFLVLYNTLEIQRLEMDNRIRYKNEDYKQLNEYYKQKTQQIHIVGEYANMMVRDYKEALQFVNDYFQMDYRPFVAKYFKGTRSGEINRNITPAKYKQLFESLSDTQRAIIDDDKSKYIVVAAGPGSGKTRVLVHKMAALLLMEDVKHEQMLMLTFSRAAATEFKKRLVDLIGNAAHFVEIMTFHSYCFDLLGRVGDLDRADTVVKAATDRINSGEVEMGRITKTVLVIDEAQDMDAGIYALVQALMARNEEMRVLAVGDDDQNIYEFRGSSARYLQALITDRDAALYELVDNYRSRRNLVNFANEYAATLSSRLKTQPIRPVADVNGVVCLIRHKSRHLEVPLVQNLIATRQSGTVGILTGTNDEALRVAGLLARKGLPAKLIQENEGFNLQDLVELRYFMKIIDRETQAPVISDEAWQQAMARLQAAYQASECLPACLDLLATFAEVNPKKYKSDLAVYISESRLEDLYRSQPETLVVSTIHKAKGREFNQVYMLLTYARDDTDEGKRMIYVGLTRAKEALYLHYHHARFDAFHGDGIERRYDPADYPEPEEMVMQLFHRDVVLGYFLPKKLLICTLRSGNPLTVQGDYLYAQTPSGAVPVVFFSKRFKEKQAAWRNKGYTPYKAKIRFILAWKGENDDQESAIILPDVYWRKERKEGAQTSAAYSGCHIANIPL